MEIRADPKGNPFNYVNYTPAPEHKQYIFPHTIFFYKPETDHISLYIIHTKNKLTK